jgi:hypothetical protein
MATGILSKAYISAIDSDLDVREINKKVTDLYNEKSLTSIMNLAGNKVVTKAPVYKTFVNESLFKLGDTTGATVTGSGSATINTKLTAATSGYVRKQDLILFPDGNSGIVQSVTTASSQDSLVIKSVNGTNITHTAGEQLSIYSMAFGENSVSGDNIKYTMTKYSNKYQIFKEFSKITDIANAHAIEVEVNGSNRVVVKDHFEKRMRLEGAINAAFWAGDMSATTFTDSSPAITDQYTSGSDGGGGVQTTRGVDKYVSTYGTLLTAASLTAYALADLDDACDTLTAKRAPAKQLVLGADKAIRRISTYFKALGSSGVQSAQLMVNGKEIDFNVSQVTHGKYEFNYASLPILDHPNLFSQTVMAKSLYYLPYDHKVKVYGDGGESSQAALATRYVPAQTTQGNEMIGEIHTGGLSPFGSTDSSLSWKTDWVSYQGLEFLAPQFAVRQKVLS